MNNSILRVVGVTIAIGMIILTTSGIHDALRFGAMTHLVAKRTALLVLWFLVAFMAMSDQSKLRQRIKAIAAVGALCCGIVIRYQVFPSWYISRVHNLSGQTLQAINGTIASNAIGSGIEMRESDGKGGYNWYVTTGNKDWVPLTFALGSPLLVGTLICLFSPCRRVEKQ